MPTACVNGLGRRGRFNLGASLVVLFDEILSPAVVNHTFLHPSRVINNASEVRNEDSCAFIPDRGDAANWCGPGRGAATKESPSDRLADRFLPFPALPRVGAFGKGYWILATSRGRTSSSSIDMESAFRAASKGPAPDSRAARRRPHFSPNTHCSLRQRTGSQRYTTRQNLWKTGGYELCAKLCRLVSSRRDLRG